MATDRSAIIDLMQKVERTRDAANHRVIRDMSVAAHGTVPMQALACAAMRCVCPSGPIQWSRGPPYRQSASPAPGDWRLATGSRIC